MHESRSKFSRCWAECLGGCDQKLSREHLITSAMFPGNVMRVEGFDWCKNAPKDIGVASLTAKILCGSHNNRLSPVDTAGAEVFEVLRNMTNLQNIRQKLRPGRWSVVRRAIDGGMLEGWFLKTLINLCVNGEHPIGRNATVAGRPDDHLVRVAYGLASFEGRAGLYSVFRQGMQLSLDDTVGVTPLIKDRVHIEGGLFIFRGLCFLLYLEPERPPQSLAGIHFQGVKEDLADHELTYHLPQLDMNIGKFRSQVLTIVWDQPPRKDCSHVRKVPSRGKSWKGHKATALR